MGSTCSTDVKILNEYTSCVSEMGDLILYRYVDSFATENVTN